MKNIYLISYSKENLGDDLFVEILLKKYPNCNFHLNSIKKENNIYNSYSNIFYTDLKFYDLNDSNIINFDVVIYVGGSIFMEHAGGIERINLLINLSNLCKLHNIPLFFISSNFGPYVTDSYKLATENLFKNCTDVCFRDKYSYNQFKDIPSVRYAPDLVFNFVSPRPKLKHKKVGINVLSFKFINNFKNLENLYFNTLMLTIKNFIDNDFEVSLLSFCNYEGDKDSINHILNNLLDKNYTDKISVLEYNGNLDEFISRYSEFEYMLCSRFHSMILSCLFNQKMYVLSYSNKLNNAIKDLSLLHEYHNLKDLKHNSYIDFKDFCLPKFNKNILKEYDNQFSKLNNYLCTTERSN